MLTFQWCAIGVAVLLSVLEFWQWRSKSRRNHLIKAAIWSAFAFCVWQPNFLQWLADQANIGRGADFLLYNLVVFSLLSSFYFLRRLEDQRRQVTELVREIALREATKPQRD